MGRLMLRILAAFSITAGAVLLPQEGAAQTYPERQVRMAVGFTAGSGPDVIARSIAAQLSNDLKQQFYVENLVGANGTLAIRSVVNAAPDGYSILYSSSSIAPIPHIYRNLGYDLATDLTPVATSGILDGYFMLVHPKFPAKSVGAFIEHAKTNRVLYGSPGVGNVLHLAAELFNVKAGLNMEHVPFRGASDVTTALLNGSIQVMFVTPPSVLPLVQSGEVRAIGFTGSKPFPEALEVPLVRDALPSYPVTGSWGMFYVPAKTPTAVVEKLNGAIRAAMKAPAVVNVVVKSGYIPDERSATETAAFFKKEVEAAGDAVRAAKIQPN